MRFVRPLLAGFAAVALIGAARPIVSFEQPPIDPAAVQIMAAYARCVVSRDPGEARMLLAADYTTDAYKKAIREFATDHRNCVPSGGKLRFNQIVLAGDTAEAILRHQQVTADQIKQKAASDQADTMPRCVIRQRADDVWALLTSKPASGEERGILAGLQGALDACTAKGAMVISNPVGLRARLALATYRLMNNPAPTSAGS